MWWVIATLGEVAGRGVHDALGLAGRAAGVEDEQRVLGVEGSGRASSDCAVHEVVPPDVAALGPSARRCRCARTTSTCCDVGQPSQASSTAGFSGTAAPRRQPPSAVMTTLASQSWMRSRSASAREAAEDDRVHARRGGRRPAWRRPPRGSSACRWRPGRPA